MISLTFIFFCLGLFTCVYSNDVYTENGLKSMCPPPENIEPCSCFTEPVHQRLTAQCANFSNAFDIKEIFNKNPQWYLQDVWIDQCVMHYIPAKILEVAHFQDLNITSTTLISLFDRPVVKPSKFKLYLTDVKLMRGFQWKLVAKTNLIDLRMGNIKIKSFGQEFKDNIPKGVKNMWLMDTGVRSIKFQAFSVLKRLQILFLRGGSLRTVSRDMFPKPSNLIIFNLSYQKISNLPEDFFVDMPKLAVFYLEGNRLTTLSEKVFIKHETRYLLEGNPLDCNCYIRWIILKFNLKFLDGECVEPKSLKGTKLRDLTMSKFSYCH